MRFISTCVTDIGRKRANNEDWLLEWPEKGLYVVADGMGGGKHGEIAAHLAVDTIEQHLVENYATVQSFRLTRSDDHRAKVRELILEAVSRANTAVYREAEKSGSRGKMGTTLTLLLAVDTEGFMAHVGDSRLYIIRNAVMTQLSTDHTMMHDYQQRYGNAASKLDAALSNTITRAIGLCETVETDLRDIDIRIGDRFFLCTDGIHRYFDGERMEELTRELAVPGIDADEERRFLNRETKRIVEATYRAGAEDNLSFILIAAREVDEGAAQEERMLDVAAVARTLPLFAGFDGSGIERLLHDAEIRTRAKYDIIAFPEHEGELLVMLEGQVSVLRRSRQIEVLTAGSLVGEVAFFSEKPLNYTLFVDKPSTFMVLRRSTIVALKEEAPRAVALFLWEICRVMAGQILTSVSHIEPR